MANSIHHSHGNRSRVPMGVPGTLSRGVKAGRRRTSLSWRTAGAVLLLWTGFAIESVAAGRVGAEQYITEVWQATEGLPGDHVTSVVQAHDGYLWVGTHRGLARFDGVRFEVFDSTTPGLETSDIRKLFVDQQGAIWVGMAQGQLTRYALGRFRMFDATGGWSMTPAVAFARGQSDDVTILDGAGAMHRFQDGHFGEAASSGTDSESERFEFGVLDGAGVHWALDGSRKLHRMSGAGWEQVVPAGDASPPAVEFMAAARGNGLWIYDGRDFRLLDGGRWTRDIEGAPELAGESVTCLMEDSSGNLWVGTSGSKLVLYGANGLRRLFSAQSGFPPGNLSSLCEDREGNIWAGSLGSGLVRLKRSVFQTFGLAEGLPPKPILSLAEDSSGRVHLGTLEGGMFVMERERFLGPLAALGTSISVGSLQPGKAGEIWAGTYGEGLLKLHGQNSRQWTPRDGLVSGKILSMYEDRTGELWLGTDLGVSRFDGLRFANYSTADGLCHNSVRVIIQDREDDFWVGTAGGLSGFRRGTFTSYFRRNGLPSDQVQTLLAGANGVIWIGTLDGGLSRFDGGRFVNYSIQHGLPDNSISAILDDGLGYLWLGTGRGICRVAHSELDAFAESRQSQIKCVTYLKKDGLDSIQCAVGNPSGIVARDGRLWFATAHGVSVVDPQRIRPNAVQPLVAIEEVSIDGELAFSNRRAGGGTGAVEHFEIAVPAGRTQVKIEYTGLSFTSPTATRFRRRLEGMDDGWRDCGTLRTVYYENLPPGNYRFQVIAANSDGVWSEFGAGLAFTVLPFYWQTWWFRGGAVAGLAGAGLLGFRRRIIRLERERAAQGMRLQSAALGCAGDGILITDREGKIVWSNPMFTQLTGYDADELAGRNVRLLKSGKHPAEFYSAMWETLLAGDVWQSEIINRKKDGSLSTHEQTTTPVRNERGKITHFVAIKRDITGRKLMERALRESEERFRTLADVSLEGIVIYDDQQILEVNRTAAGMFGYTPAELIGNSVLGLVNPATRAAVLEHIRSGSDKPYECSGHRKDGTPLEIEIYCRACPFGGRTVRVAAIRDITETRQSQKRIQLLEQHKALETERIRIARDMHDEMGASLTKITLLGEAAELELAGRDQPEHEGARARLQRISVLGRSLVASMDEIVWAVNPGNDTLEGFASYICHFAPNLLKLAAIQCRLSVPGEMPRQVLRSQVRHHLLLAVKEALHNVIKHSRATHVNLSVELPSDWLSVTITDNGCGFERGESSRIGNGLVNMQQRMKQIDGEMEFSSQPGHGVRIMLRVPLASGGSS